jgi:hypothetical protein
MLVPIYQFSQEFCFVFIVVYAETMRFSIGKFADENVFGLTVVLDTYAIFYTVAPLSLIPVAVRPGMKPVPMGFGRLPIPLVRVAMWASPSSFSLLTTVIPLPCINLSICPLINSKSLSFPAHKTSSVVVPVLIVLDAEPVPDVVFPLPVVHASVAILHGSQAMSLIADHVAYVLGVCECFLLIWFDAL